MIDDMNLIPGTKVRYIGTCDEQVKWGSNDDPRGLLTEGDVYTVNSVEVHSWHTKITLREFPELKFNCVSFEEVNKEARNARLR